MSFLIALLLNVSTFAAEPPIAIGTRVEPLVDRFLIDRIAGDARHVLVEPTRREVALITDKPWEGPDAAYYSVLRDDKTIRLYYRGACPNDLSDKQVTCLAESSDGVVFERPNLGILEFAGSKANNIVFAGVEAHNFAPMLDSNPKAIPEERYKALGGVSSKLSAFVSADGYHWRRKQAEPVLTQGAFDSLNIGFYDPIIGKYRCYSRYFEAGIRKIQSCVSDDFVHWTKPTPNLYAANAPIEHFYTNATTPCPGAGHILLSFPKRFVESRIKLPGYRETGVSDAMFMTSRDGVRWDRTFLEAWLRPGVDQRNWSQRSNMVAWGIIETGRDEFSLYVSERYGWPDNRLRRLTIPRHRFASIRAGAAGGEFVTKPFTFTGKKLILNYATSAAGSVRVEAQRADGQAIEGYTLADSVELFGDEFDAAFRWKSRDSLAPLIGQPIRLRFALKDADIFAIRTE